jgi:hypothetical protein
MLKYIAVIAGILVSLAAIGVVAFPGNLAKSSEVKALDARVTRLEVDMASISGKLDIIIGFVKPKTQEE